MPSQRGRLKIKITLLANRQQIRRQLKQACTSHDPVRARYALLEWGRVRWPNEFIHGLHQIADKSPSTALRLELSRLDAVLFANHRMQWNGLALWQSIVVEGKPKTRFAKSGTRLPQLYPQQA
ncbi:MAG: hypothetical protein GY896_09570 [Gammaproteobacteria bacterium]|nr:hypothetical protein [Gammaproteobacteria bacterium]